MTRRPRKPVTGKDETQEPSSLQSRIRALETELAALRQAVDLQDIPAAERGRNVEQHYLEVLSTVNVPAEFETPFLRAQEYVARYFADHEENPDTATISRAGERYVLVRAASLSVEFVELVMSLYKDKSEAEARSLANNLLFDLAHAIGKADARSFQEKMEVTDPIETLSAGPVHFAFSGWAFVDISPRSSPTPDDDYFLLYEHPYSFESHSWMAKDKPSDQPVCIMNAGYSSGWCEESFGIPLVAVETECLAAGGDCCRFIMAPPSRIEDHLAQHQHDHEMATGSRASTSEIPEFFQRKRLEDELREANLFLEERVQSRTRELEEATAQLRVLGSAVENATEGFVIMESAEGEEPLRITFVNRGFTRITGFTPEDIVGRSPDFIPVADDDRVRFDEMFDSVRAGRTFDAEVTALRPDGSEYELELHVMPADPSAQASQRWIAILHDVSHRKAHLDELRWQALHDELTGLPNRVLLHDRIEQSVRKNERDGSRFGVLLLDLDGFKEINDTFGHYIGDILLTKLASRLQGRMRAPDTISRLGGDEFAVLLDGVDGPEDAMVLAQRLLEGLQKPFEVGEQSLVVGASIGIVLCPDHGKDPDTLMRCADIAMYAAKSSHAGALIYDTELDVHSPARIRLVSELRNCIDDSHLVLHYQPQVRLSDDEVTKVEALLRWKHPDGRLLLPGAFLPLAETTELIDRISRWVLRAAIRDCREWLDAGMKTGISVNLATRNLHDRELPGNIQRLLEEYDVPADLLTLEITESGIIRESIMADDIFERLRGIGVGLSIDDFGTGYSSLIHLKHLPFTELKIDRTFTRDLMENHRDAAIVRSTIDLAHALGRTIVAEGVEEGRTLEYLREYGCDYAQGFLFTRALEKSDLINWLSAVR